jgi:hypothetical protein
VTARRAARRELLASKDILPLDLMSHVHPDLFAGIRVRPDGRPGIDYAVSRRNVAAEADLKRRFETWFASRGISTKFADSDARFEDVLAASRAHWGLNHQGKPRGPASSK